MWVFVVHGYNYTVSKAYQVPPPVLYKQKKLFSGRYVIFWVVILLLGNKMVFRSFLKVYINERRPGSGRLNAKVKELVDK